jgi:AraC-like DNA-binding protein
MPRDPSPPSVPMRYLRSEMAYRSMGASREISIGVGFLQKSGQNAEFFERKVTHYSAVWCLRGGGTYHDDAGQSWPIRPGTLFHRFCERKHSQRVDAGGQWAECFIALNEPLAAALIGMGVLDLRRPVQSPGIDLAVIEDLSRLVGALREAEERELPRMASQLVAALADLVTREDARLAADPHREAIDRACRRMVADPRLPLPELATELRMSYERFRKVFRERLGVSPGEYRIRRRIDRARALLQADDRPIKAVAEELGYPNPYAFSAQFKQLVGESPEAFRKRH